ncbi:hypothetical protein PJM52_29195, partial [Mycobacterium kansasii]
MTNELGRRAAKVPAFLRQEALRIEEEAERELAGFQRMKVKTEEDEKAAQEEREAQKKVAAGLRAWAM